jgi:hypothetical protein
MKLWKREVDAELDALTDGLYSLREFTDEQLEYLFKSDYDAKSAAFQLVYVGVYL